MCPNIVLGTKAVSTYIKTPPSTQKPCWTDNSVIHEYVKGVPLEVVQGDPSTVTACLGVFECQPKGSRLIRDAHNLNHNALL